MQMINMNMRQCKEFIKSQIEELNNDFLKKNFVRYEVLSKYRRREDNHFATYFIRSCHIDFLYPTIWIYDMSEIGIRGLVLHEFGHHIEHLLIEDIFLWDIDCKRKRMGEAEKNMREFLADNISYLIDPEATIQHLKELFAYDKIRMYRIGSLYHKDFWYSKFLRLKRKYDVIKIKSDAFDFIKKSEVIDTLLMRVSP